MRDSTVRLVEEAVALIEENIKQPFWLESLARDMYISKFHLHRLFKALTGKTLMSYVRGRRLSRSLYELVNSDLNISYIAEEYCFNYEQSYERAFKNEFGVSPSFYRKSPCELNITNMFDTSTLRDIAQGIFVEPRFCFVPELKVAGLPAFIPADNYMKANKAAVSFINSERGKVASRINEHVYYGFTFPPSGNGYIYMPCVEVSEAEGAPGFEIRVFPPCLYAVFRYVGFHSPNVLSDYYIGDFYNYIQSEWLQKTKFIRSRDYLIERIDASVCSSTYCEADVYVPVSDSSLPRE
jgi:AraC family transcriptional regulator